MPSIKSKEMISPPQLFGDADSLVETASLMVDPASLCECVLNSSDAPLVNDNEPVEQESKEENLADERGNSENDMLQEKSADPDQNQNVESSRSRCTSPSAEVPKRRSERIHREVQNQNRAEDENHNYQNSVMERVLRAQKTRFLRVVLRRLEDEDLTKLLSKKTKAFRSTSGNASSRLSLSKKKLKSSSKKRRVIYATVFKRKLISCNLCSRQFLNVGILKKHQEKACSWFGKCKVCLRKFKDPERLNEHNVSSCDTEAVFACEVCNRRYKFKRLLKEHQTPTCRTLQYRECSKCGRKFKSAGDLSRHSNNCVDKAEPMLSFLCHVCGEVIDTAKQKFVDHMRRHYNERPCSCKECGKTFKNRWALRKHSQIHSEVRPFTCAECGKSFKALHSLNMHLSVHGMMTPFSMVCKVCGKVLHSNHNFESHMKKHSRETLNKCELCKRTFGSAEKLQLHFPNCDKSKIPNDEEKPHLCKVCGKAFTKRPNLTRHISRIHRKREAESDGRPQRKPHVCLECGKSFVEVSNLKKHMTDIHGDLEKHLQSVTEAKTFVCKDCGKVYQHVRSLREHIIVVHAELSASPEEKIHVCNDCGKSFHHMKNLKRHRLVHASRSCICQQCGKGFRTIRNLKTHALTHSKEKPFPCSLCDQSFSIGPHLERHMLIHVQEWQEEMAVKAPQFVGILPKEEEKPCTCSDCGKIFNNLFELNEHSVEHSNLNQSTSSTVNIDSSVCDFTLNSNNQVEIRLQIRATEKPFKCNLCGKGCRLEGHLKLHFQKVHCGEVCKREHVCSTCGAKFNENSQLQTHLRVHLNKRPSCNLCGNSFNCEKNLKEHLRTVHRNRKLCLPCRVCGKIFPRADSLRRHLRNVHSIISSANKFICKICEKTYWSQSHYDNHVRIHHEEKPFSCNRCNKQFKTTSSLQSHAKVHSDEQLYSCSICSGSFKGLDSFRHHIRFDHISPGSSGTTGHLLDTIPKQEFENRQNETTEVSLALQSQQQNYFAQHHDKFFPPAVYEGLFSPNYLRQHEVPLTNLYQVKEEQTLGEGESIVSIQNW